MQNLSKNYMERLYNHCFKNYIGEIVSNAPLMSNDISCSSCPDCSASFIASSTGRSTVLQLLPEWKPCCSELEFLKRLWGLGTGEEEGYRTGPAGYIRWRNSFLGIDSGAPYTFKNTSSEYSTVFRAVASLAVSILVRIL